MIAVIDYDMGNLRSVSKALEKVGAKVCVTRDKKKIQNADKIVLPGVGAFPKCVENLKKYDLFDLIPKEIKKGKQFLGICLGLQLLFEESEEFGGSKGLEILRGRVKKFSFQDLAKSKQEAGNRKHEEGLTHLRIHLRQGFGGQAYALTHLKVPHMGWNQIKIQGEPSVLRGIPDQSLFYFVHSYYVEPLDKSYTGTQTEYGISFCSSIQKDNIFACQFHPEKSQKLGLRILENFVKFK